KAEFGFGVYLVAIGYRYLPHIIAESGESGTLPIVPGRRRPGPGIDLTNHVIIFPMTGNDLAIDAQFGNDMAEFTIAVGTLVKVHEIHVDGVPRNITVVLRMEMQQWFLEDIQPPDPHLAGGECMHPCDDADTGRLMIGSGDSGMDFIRCFDNRFEN